MENDVDEANHVNNPSCLHENDIGKRKFLFSSEGWKCKHEGVTSGITCMHVGGYIR